MPENRGFGERHRDTIAEMEPLDNPVWHALTGPQAEFSEGSSLALRYPPDVAVFAALPDEVGADAWSALGRLVGPGGAAVLFRPGAVSVPDAWQITMRMNSLQMVATEPIGAADETFSRLGAADVDEMLALVERTRPGPFARRTVELGTYLGQLAEVAGAEVAAPVATRLIARLIAMTGERVHLPGYTELSAVCTDPEARKLGLATRLVRAVAAGIEARGETPILHVLAENHSAIRVYEALGFETRAAFETIIVQAPR
jgi:ribosomal protein S18 acetylase RimI-like enzyme